MIDARWRPGMPVNVSPKYWAEHLGMPYHQADIRELEMPRAGQTATRADDAERGSRSFTRYGYGDLLREDRKYGVLHRIWPGTQRLLLWGDPVRGRATRARSDSAAATAWRSWSRCRSKAGAGRASPADAQRLRRRVARAAVGLGEIRILVSASGAACRTTQSEPDALQREASALPPASAEALASASRILPIITTAHLPSAANNTYWPEIYWNQPMVDPRNDPYTDTPAPKPSRNASPLDPQLFSTMSDLADELLKRSAAASTRRSRSRSGSRIWRTASCRIYRRSTEPVCLRSGMLSSTRRSGELGQFFAAKFRAASSMPIHERTAIVGRWTNAADMACGARRAELELARTIYAADLRATTSCRSADNGSTGSSGSTATSSGSRSAAHPPTLRRRNRPHAVTQALGRPRHDPRRARRRRRSPSARSRVAASAEAHRARPHRARRLPLPPREPGGNVSSASTWTCIRRALDNDPGGLHRLPYRCSTYFTLIESPDALFVPGLGADLTVSRFRRAAVADFHFGMQDPNAADGSVPGPASVTIHPRAPATDRRAWPPRGNVGRRAARRQR